MFDSGFISPKYMSLESQGTAEQSELLREPTRLIYSRRHDRHHPIEKLVVLLCNKEGGQLLLLGAKTDV